MKLETAWQWAVYNSTGRLIYTERTRAECIEIFLDQMGGNAINWRTAKRRYSLTICKVDIVPQSDAKP